MQCDLHFGNRFSNFVNRERICTPGDSVKVTLDLNLKGATRIEELHIIVTGSAKTKFTKQQQNGRNKLVNGHSELISTKIEILRNAELSTGNHKFQSIFELPANIPSSFRFENNSKNKITPWRKTGCAIKYKIQVIVHRAGNPLKRFDFPFDVVRAIDLNVLQPSLRKMREVKTLNSNGISGDFSMSASIPQRGYVPGENIVVTVNVNNKSTIAIKGIEVALIKKIILGSRMSINNKENLAERDEEEWILTETSESCGEVMAGEKREFRRIIKVPPLQPVIDNCELIQVCYRIWIRAVTNVAGRRETLVLPIVIGTVPLTNVAESKEEEKKKLKLIMPSQSQIDQLCDNCAELNLVTTASGSPEVFDPQAVPETPMSPTPTTSSMPIFETTEIIEKNSKNMQSTTEIAAC